MWVQHGNFHSQLSHSTTTQADNSCPTVTSLMPVTHRPAALEDGGGDPHEPLPVRQQLPGVPAQEEAAVLGVPAAAPRPEEGRLLRSTTACVRCRQKGRPHPVAAEVILIRSTPGQAVSLHRREQPARSAPRVCCCSCQSLPGQPCPTQGGQLQLLPPSVTPAPAGRNTETPPPAQQTGTCTDSLRRGGSSELSNGSASW